jgi:hypothetical protein
VLLPDLGGGQLGAVAAQHVSQHREGLALTRPALLGGCSRAGRVSGALAVEAIVAVQFRCGPDARLRISGPG